ncbi:hypothetical protein MRX96_025416 [Rhipicephalus microplus]
MAANGKPSPDAPHPDYAPTVFPYGAHLNAEQKISKYECANKRTSEQMTGFVKDDAEISSIACEYVDSNTGTGAITYISKAWGGRTSDKELTPNSGLLEKVEEEDIFLVDRGFSCEDMFGA